VTVGANTVNIVNGNVHTSALHAALWNGMSGPVDLGVLPGDTASIATGVSADGTVVVGISDPVGLSGQTGTSGYGYNVSTSHAFVWTQATGMQDLTLLMTQAGALAAGTSLVAALSISPDGQEIAGAGLLPGTPQDTGSGYVVRYCNGDCPDDSAPLVAAALPVSRSIEVGNTATALATIINPSASALTGCFITPATALPATFAYQTTDPATNALTGTANTPVSIPAGGSQSFVFALTANAAFPPTQVNLGFECTYAGPAAVVVGLDTLLLSASATPVPDVLALGATTSNDGILRIIGTGGSAAFAVATDNVGTDSTITATANTGSASLPLALTSVPDQPPDRPVPGAACRECDDGDRRQCDADLRDLRHRLGRHRVRPANQPHLCPVRRSERRRTRRHQRRGRDTIALTAPRLPGRTSTRPAAKGDRGKKTTRRALTGRLGHRLCGRVRMKMMAKSDPIAVRLH
jgi:hypothetical protein